MSDNLLDEAGNPLLDEAGNPLLTEGGASPPPVLTVWNYAVPGIMWPGFALPGEPVTGAGPGGNGYVFTGGHPLVYPQYLDEEDLKTLVAEPGGFYLILPVGGNPGLALPPNDDDDWQLSSG